MVPFYNVEAYLAECLDSLLAQDFEDFEVLLVDDGSPDGSRAIAEDYARRDPRLRLLTRPNGGLGAARNTGVRAARGEFLTFVDSDDLLPLDALGILVDTARRTGSDVVTGAVERFDSVAVWVPDWVSDVHGEPRDRIRVEEFLPLLRNLYTWNKLFRRDFFLAQDLWFREGVAYEDQPIITQLYARARAIDVVTEVVYRYRSRDDKSSISQQTATLADLRQRVEAWQVSRRVLSAEAPDAVYRGWLQTLFDAHFHWYLRSPGVMDDAYWDELVTAVRSFAEGATEEIWRGDGSGSARPDHPGAPGPPRRRARVRRAVAPSRPSSGPPGSRRRASSSSSRCTTTHPSTRRSSCSTPSSSSLRTPWRTSTGRRATTGRSTA